MKKLILTLLLGFLGLAAFSQNASSSASQTVSFQLRDISIVEKTPAATGNWANGSDNLQVQSAGSWVISAKKINSSSLSVSSTQQNDYILPVENQESMEKKIYTLSKI